MNGLGPTTRKSRLQQPIPAFGIGPRARDSAHRWRRDAQYGVKHAWESVVQAREAARLRIRSSIRFARASNTAPASARWAGVPAVSSSDIGLPSAWEAATSEPKFLTSPSFKRWIGPRTRSGSTLF